MKNGNLDRKDAHHEKPRQADFGRDLICTFKALSRRRSTCKGVRGEMETWRDIITYLGRISTRIWQTD